jgi:hypothetical protein
VRRNFHRPGGLLLRTARQFLRRNELRRRSDRVEAVLLAAALAAFAVAVVVAVSVAARVYHSEQTAAAGLRPAVAVISQPSAPTEAQILDQSFAVRATWRLSDGAERSGWLTASLAPGVGWLQPGASVRVWLNRAGLPEPAPRGTDGTVIGAAIAGLTVLAAAAAFLACWYLLCLRALERQRLAQWSSAWDVTGPHWTGRR